MLLFLSDYYLHCASVLRASMLVYGLVVFRCPSAQVTHSSISLVLMVVFKDCFELYNDACYEWAFICEHS